MCRLPCRRVTGSSKVFLALPFSLSRVLFYFDYIGAGKTTLISVLTGLYEPTSGTARIAGYDLSTDINSIHHHLGVCPQFDIHHAELSSQEHLLFYARLKGVKWGQEKAVVTRALQQVCLL